MKKKILVAGPNGLCGGPFDVNAATFRFLNTGQGECFSSLDPLDVAQSDGVVLPGGLPDVSPRYWGQENAGCLLVDEELDKAQFAMLERAVALGKPILGICRGYQLAAVSFGGDLIQDIGPKQFHGYDPQEPRFHLLHNVPGTAMHRLLGDTTLTNSLHHQALRRVPRCLQVEQLWCARPQELPFYLQAAAQGRLLQGSGECLIEAVSHRVLPFVGVQWHPELDGPLLCRAKDTQKIRQRFYEMMENAAG